MTVMSLCSSKITGLILIGLNWISWPFLKQSLCPSRDHVSSQARQWGQPHADRVKEEFLKGESGYFYHKWGWIGTGWQTHKLSARWHLCPKPHRCKHLAHPYPRLPSFSPLSRSQQRGCDGISSPQPDILEVFLQIIPIPLAAPQESFLHLFLGSMKKRESGSTKNKGF